MADSFYHRQKSSFRSRSHGIFTTFVLCEDASLTYFARVKMTPHLLPRTQILLLHLVFHTTLQQTASVTQFAREEIQSSQICGAGIIEAINRAGCSQYNREAGAWLLFAFLHLEESPIVCWLSDVSLSAASKARDELFPENGRRISTSAGWICWPSTLLHTEFRFFVHNWSPFAAAGSGLVVLILFCSLLSLPHWHFDWDLWCYHHSRQVKCSISLFSPFHLAMKLCFCYCHHKTCQLHIAPISSLQHRLSLLAEAEAFSLWIVCLSFSVCDWCLTGKPSGGHTDLTALLAAIDSFSLKP